MLNFSQSVLIKNQWKANLPDNYTGDLPKDAQIRIHLITSRRGNCKYGLYYSVPSYPDRKLTDEIYDTLEEAINSANTFV